MSNLVRELGVLVSGDAVVTSRGTLLLLILRTYHPSRDLKMVSYTILLLLLPGQMAVGNLRQVVTYDD